MTKSDVMQIYGQEELVPIVAKLARLFTSNESSSVTFERAKLLMDAVVFHIQHVDQGTGIVVSRNGLSAEAAYNQGYQNVVNKVKATQEQYNQLMTFFDSYGNRNYQDTVEKALHHFFFRYDVRFAPTDQIITMDYPVFHMDESLEGIDRIVQYIDKIWEEQMYLRKFPREIIIDTLREFHPRYEQEFFNLREIVDIYM